MELGIYLLKSVIILSIFYGVFFVFLRKDTLFTAKRHFLLGGILAALFLPFLEFTRTIYKEASVFEPLPFSESVSVNAAEVVQSGEAFSVDVWQVALVIYSLGVLILAGRLLSQVFSLLKLIRTYPSEKRKKYTFVRIDEAVSPFSFFRYIVYNPTSHSKEELQMILKHEQVHVSQWHSIDIIAANLARVLQWINPFSWLYKRSLEENLEFIADYETVGQVSSKKEYQLTLVKASSSLPALALTTQFYQSFIKKRIIMLNKSTSKRRNLWKLSIVLPALALFLWSFNVKEVVTYREAESTLMEEKGEAPIFKILSSSTNEQLDEIENYFDRIHSEVRIKIGDRKRSNKGDLLGFSFKTKFGNTDRFHRRFSVEGSENKKFGGYWIRYTEGPALLVDALKHNGEKIKISADKVELLGDTEFNTKQLFDKHEDLPGVNPSGFMNDKDSFKENQIQNVAAKSEDGLNLNSNNSRFTTNSETAKKVEVLIPEGTAVQQNNTLTERTLTKEVVGKEFRFTITKKTANTELEAMKTKLKKEHNIDMKYKVDRNSNGEITSILISYTDNKGWNGNYAIEDDHPIEDFVFYLNDDGERGFWSEAHEERREERYKYRTLEREKRDAERTERMLEREIEMEERREEMDVRRNEIVKRSYDNTKVLKDRDKEIRERELAIVNGKKRSNYESEATVYSSDAAENAIIIDKDTTDETLAKMKTKLAAKGITFTYSKIRRNSQGEITRIKITTDDGTGNRSSVSATADDGEPIREMLIKI
jgi:beta-lactamase regulating signal transducer with metallopeptidase domain